MSKHTEGPWTVDRRSSFLHIDANGILVGSIEERNAHLIAAAPELFDALRLDVYSRRLLPNRPRGIVPTTHHALLSLRPKVAPQLRTQSSL